VAAGEFAGRLPSRPRDAGPLDAIGSITDNFLKATGRSIAVEVRDVEELRDSLARLRLEVAELQASRERLVLAADADRRQIERELHDGLQQQLIGLAVSLQLARQRPAIDPSAMDALLEELGRDVQQAVEATGELAQRIYPPLLEAGGLAAAVRAAAVSAGVRTHVDVAAATDWPPAVAGAAYFCCLVVLERAGDGAQATVTVREEKEALVFEVVANVSGDGLGPLRDRVEALGGQLTITSEAAGGTRVSGSLPLSR
jgi:signal transduction histidine kinase